MGTPGERGINSTHPWAAGSSQRVHQQAGAQLRLEPGALRRHDLPGIGDGDQLVDRRRVHRKATLQPPRPRAAPVPPCRGCRPRSRCGCSCADRRCPKRGQHPLLQHADIERGRRGRSRRAPAGPCRHQRPIEVDANDRGPSARAAWRARARSLLHAARNAAGSEPVRDPAPRGCRAGSAPATAGRAPRGTSCTPPGRRVAPAWRCAAARAAAAAVVAVGDVGQRHRREDGSAMRRAAAVRRARPCARTPSTRRQIVERRVRAPGATRRVDRRSVAVGEEDRPGVGVQAQRRGACGRLPCRPGSSRAS